MPSRLGAQGSKSNKLESTSLTKNLMLKYGNVSSLAQILSLAPLSLESHKEIQRWVITASRDSREPRLEIGPGV